MIFCFYGRDPQANGLARRDRDDRLILPRDFVAAIMVGDNFDEVFGRLLGEKAT
jgi:hypothetical protein